MLEEIISRGQSDLLQNSASIDEDVACINPDMPTVILHTQVPFCRGCIPRCGAYCVLVADIPFQVILLCYVLHISVNLL